MEQDNMINNIQLLRAIACFMVVFYHLQVMVGASYPVHCNTQFGTAGVDIFFVISGFVMFYITRSFDRTPFQFWKERIIRVVPLYWIVTFMIVFAFKSGFHPNGLHALNLRDLITSIFFIPDIRADGVSAPILVVGWTLIYEMFFYFLLGLTLFLRSQRKIWIVLTLFFVSLCFVRRMFGPFSFALDYYMNPIMLEFSAGCLLGIVYARVDISKWPFPRALGYGLIGMGAIVIALPDAVFPGLLHLTRDSFSGSMTRCGIFGIPAFMIVAGALVLEKAGHLWKGRALLLQGAASYAIYLFHTVGMQGFVKAMAFVFPAKDFSMGLIVMILSMIFIGCIGTGVHLFVEKPLQKMMKAKKLSFSVKTT